MKLLIPRSHLKDAIAGLAKVVNQRASIPILAHVRLDAEGKSIRLTGTDLSQVATCEIAAESASAPVSFLIPLDALQSVLKTAQGPSIEIEPGMDAVTIVAEVAGQTSVAASRPPTSRTGRSWPCPPTPNLSSLASCRACGRR